MARTILMGDPTHFGVYGGANPHTRNVLGVRKKVDSERARQQWHSLAKALIAHGTEICVIEPHPGISGLVYPANAGFLYPLEAPENGVTKKKFYLANLLPTRAAECEIYLRFIRSMGYETAEIRSRFEGEADFFGGQSHDFHARADRTTALRAADRDAAVEAGLRLSIGRRCSRKELRAIAQDRTIIELELTLEAHYHGDTVLCSFGPQRELSCSPTWRAWRLDRRRFCANDSARNCFGYRSRMRSSTRRIRFRSIRMASFIYSCPRE